MNRRKQRASRRGSASSSDEQWIYSESLKFLDPFIAPRSTSSNDIIGSAAIQYDDYDDADASIDHFDDEETGTSTTTTGAPVSEDDTESFATTTTTTTTPLAKPTKISARVTDIKYSTEKMNARNNEYNPKKNQSDHAPFLSFLSDQLDHMTPKQLLLAKEQLLNVTFRILKDT